MKTKPIRRSNGFTLIELLVVIAIIAVLAGAGFAAGNAAIQKAKRTTAQATCVALEAAVNNFYTEYGTMPVQSSTGSSDPAPIQTDNDELLRVLLGLETNATPLNPRRIKFLSVKNGKNRRDGLVYRNTGSNPSVEGLFDPWGGPYFVQLDGDYNEKVEPKPNASPRVVLNGRRVAAWSNGADAAPSGTGGNATDDVKTW